MITSFNTDLFTIINFEVKIQHPGSTPKNTTEFQYEIVPCPYQAPQDDITPQGFKRPCKTG